MILTQRRRAAEEKELDVMNMFVLNFGMATMKEGICLMLILGIAFSLLPSVLWPAVPKIVPMKQLGTAYSIIYYIQNIGLMLIPIIIGGVLQRNTVGDKVDYTEAMWIFTGIGIAAIIVSIMLLAIDKRRNYGLQKANITKE